MDISGITGLQPVGSIDAIKQAFVEKADDKSNGSRVGAFEDILNSAVNMLKETNAYSNEAAAAELDYAIGGNTSTADVLVAQMKANVSLQYTVAIRNAVLEAYKEIMQMQF